MEHVKKLAGVWLDQHEAHIISNHNGNSVSSLQIKGQVKSTEHSAHGSEHTANNAKVNALHKYFNAIMEHLTNTQELFLLGTGTAKEQLMHYLTGIPQWKNIKITEEAAGKLNAAQTLDKVAAHYKQSL